jgi:predicted RecA/RadA family phage recombinase
MINFVQPGGIIEITAPTGGVTSGSPVQVGAGIIGIGALDALVTESVNIQVEGVFDVAKVSAQAWAEGDPIYWDATAALMTTVKGGLFAGYAVAAAANPSSTGRMRLSPGSDIGFHIGLAAVPVVQDITGNHLEAHFDNGATSGWPCGCFVETNVTGAGGSFTAGQFDGILTAAKATVTGIENWMQINTGGRVTGACRSVQGTIDFSNEDKGSGGVYSGACFNIKGQGSSVDIGACQRVSCLELKTEGTFPDSANGFQKKAAGYAIYINGFTAAAGVGSILSSTSLAELPAGTLGLRVGVGGDAAAGTAYYIPLVLGTAWN